jgi:hypothetical protein
MKFAPRTELCGTTCAYEVAGACVAKLELGGDAQLKVASVTVPKPQASETHYEVTLLLNQKLDIEVTAESGVISEVVLSGNATRGGSTTFEQPYSKSPFRLQYSDCTALRAQKVYITVVGDGLANLKVAVSSTPDCMAAPPALKPAGDCTKTGSNPTCPPETWTVMVYMSADNDLEYFAVQDGYEMASARYTALKMVVMMDRGDTDDKEYTGKLVNFPDFNGGREFVVQQNKLIDTKSILPGDEPNMAEEQTLADFISRTFRQFPADHYGLILWDHGMSWTGYGVDEDPGPHAYLTFKQVLGAIKTGLESAQVPKFDFIGFDACLMASMELLPMIAPYADYYLASEDLEPGHGWNYHYLDRLSDNNYVSAQDITKALWDGFFKGDQVPVTLGIMNLSHAGGFVAAVEALAGLLVKELSTPGVVLGFLQAADVAYRMGGEFVDFGHFVKLLIEKLPESGYSNTDHAALVAAARAVETVQLDLFLVEKHSEDVPDATGLNVYLPDTDTSWGKRSKLFYQLYGYKDWHYLVGCANRQPFAYGVHVRASV